jgi:hypothetical protein
MAWRDIV